MKTGKKEMGIMWFLTSKENINHFAQHAQSMLDAGTPIRVQLVVEERTPDQNNLFHSVVRIAAEQLGYQVEELKNIVKLQIGVPMLRDKNPDFRESYDRAIKGSLSYEQKVAAMELLPVTSLMTKKDFAQLIDDTIQWCAEQGVDFGELKIVGG